jgi:hypothetical protein
MLLLAPVAVEDVGGDDCGEDLEEHDRLPFFPIDVASRLQPASVPPAL